MSDIQPGDHEAAGAINGMAELYGEPFILEGVRVGQHCSYEDTNGETGTGYVVHRDEAARTYRITEHIPGQGRRLHLARFDKVSPF